LLTRSCISSNCASIANLGSGTVNESIATREKSGTSSSATFESITLELIEQSCSTAMIGKSGLWSPAPIETVPNSFLVPQPFGRFEAFAGK
jgi:hypothetical protein